MGKMGTMYQNELYDLKTKLEISSRCICLWDEMPEEHDKMEIWK